MKNLNILSLLVIFALLFAAQPASAVVTVKNGDNMTGVISKKELKKQERLEKAITKAEKKLDKLQKKGVDFSDPVNKWLWFAIFAAIAAVVFSILGSFALYGLWYIGYLLWLAASVFFVIWLLKVLEVM
jgi:hypothetical protein